MKHIFILNPAAGNGKITRKLHPRIIESCKAEQIDYEIHRTVGLGDARKYTNIRCIEADGTPIRFYSCGGDGTLNEVVNGMIGFDNAELAVVPTGTGNDFVRNFHDWQLFRNISAQINGGTIKIDTIRYKFLDLTEEDKKNYEIENKMTSGYAINMLNMGFDAQAVMKAAEYKKRPFINGTMAYIAGVLAVLVKLRSIEVEIDFRDGRIITGEYTLLGVANGRYSGGGFDGTPHANINDGLMDLSLVKKVTRRSFLSLVKSYHDGNHINDPRLLNIYSHYRSNNLVLKPKGKVVMAIDGETVNVGNVEFSINEKSVRFVLPAGVSLDYNTV